jgi:tRNA(Ile)-lysidine synthase
MDTETGESDHSDSSSSEWMSQFQRKLKRWRHSTIVAAVSGGSDSVALLHLLHAEASRRGLTLSVAHFDHGIRGEASRADAHFVEELARSLGLECDVARWEPGQGAHLETRARRARYAWLAGVAQARGASAVAAAHTYDDQAETILHRIIRGTGPRGLTGMPARRTLSPGVTLIRPLLHATRQQLRDHLASLGQTWREDATNFDPAQTRARIRHDLLPLLSAEYNPKIKDALVRLGQLEADEHRLLEQRLDALERRAIIELGPDGVLFRRRVLTRVPRVLRSELLRRVWHRQGWPEKSMNAERWRRLSRLLKTRPTDLIEVRRRPVGGGIDVSLTSETAYLHCHTPPCAPPAPQPWRMLGIPATVEWLDGSIVATLDLQAPADETVDLDVLTPPLWVTQALPGDRFDPLGLDGKTQAVSDFFRSRNVAYDERPRVPIIRDTEGIVWIAGHRIAHRVRQTPKTQRLLGLRYERHSPDSMIGL